MNVLPTLANLEKNAPTFWEATVVTAMAVLIQERETVSLGAS